LINTRFYHSYHDDSASPPPPVSAPQAVSSAPKPAAATIDVVAARAAGLSIKGPDDLTVVEGIGPKIAELLHAGGITTFAALAGMSPAGLQAILDAAGPNFKLAVPATWPEQAALAAQNRWAELKVLQDKLNAGRVV
jgi:predicted flap endonuclease-1-like 5' DNA nuclease